MQVATKAGVLNVPEWYEAGSVWVKNNPGFPFGESPRKAPDKGSLGHRAPSIPLLMTRHRTLH